MFFNNSSKSERIYVRVTEKQKEDLKSIADKEDLTLSKFILKCIDFYLKNNNN